MYELWGRVMTNKIDIEQVNALMKGLPESALKLCPDDTQLIFLTASLPPVITEGNFPRSVAILCLICRRVAVVFNQLATEFEEATSYYGRRAVVNYTQTLYYSLRKSWLRRLLDRWM